MNSTLPGPNNRDLESVVCGATFAAEILTTIQAISTADTEAEVLDLLFSVRDSLGVEQAVFASFIRDDDSHESFRVMSAASAQWCLNYRDEDEWFSNDAWLLHASTRSEPAVDSEITYRNKGQVAKRDIAIRNGAKSSLIVPAPSSAGLSRLGILVLGSNQEDFFRGCNFVAYKALCRSLAMELGEWWIKHIRRELLDEYRVTDEELELLRRERLGHPTKQIATDLGITEASVNNRFQRLNAKFDTPNRRATANQAAEYGMI